MIYIYPALIFDSSASHAGMEFSIENHFPSEPQKHFHMVSYFPIFLLGGIMSFSLWLCDLCWKPSSLSLNILVWYFIVMSFPKKLSPPTHSTVHSPGRFQSGGHDLLSSKFSVLYLWYFPFPGFLFSPSKPPVIWIWELLNWFFNFLILSLLLPICAIHSIFWNTFSTLYTDSSVKTRFYNPIILKFYNFKSFLIL